MMKADVKGLYIHIPFCRSKCPYCDFYSLTADEKTKDEYTASIIKNIILYREKADAAFSTVYLGGGTPSQLGSERLSRIISAVSKAEDCEVTVECNPFDLATCWNEKDMALLRSSGVNRISMGMQSVIESERKTLGRRADEEKVRAAVRLVNFSGIDNLSLDLMLGIPGQTVDSVRKSIDFCAESGAKHVSSYLLKIEPGTAFAQMQGTLSLPDEDESCDIYLASCEFLEDYGYRQYEISNFAFPGYESRHNLLYWDCREYLGLGPAAHSFVDGKRFYYERDIRKFINGTPPVDDGEGGDFEEYVMLRLRLTQGLTDSGCMERFGRHIPDDIMQKAKSFERNGLTVCDENGIHLTPQGFLVSNSIISALLS